MLKRRVSKTKIAFFIILIISIAFLGFLEHSLRKTVEVIGEAQAVWQAANAINTTVMEKIAATVSYGDLIEVEKDFYNQVVFMQINTTLLNEIKSGAAIEIQQTLQQLRKTPISIPFGQVLGLRLFANMGPLIKFSVVPIGTVRIDVVDSFEAAGINQTRHRIYLTAESKVQVVFPLMESISFVSTQIPIADAIIVGPVPQFYLDNSTFR